MAQLSGRAKALSFSWKLAKIGVQIGLLLTLVSVLNILRNYLVTDKYVSYCFLH